MTLYAAIKFHLLELASLLCHLKLPPDREVAPSHFQRPPSPSRTLGSNEPHFQQCSEMPICIECRFPVNTLYTTYSKADDRTLGKGVRLTQCPRCKRFADKYVEHDFVVLFIDLVLIKPQVRTKKLVFPSNSNILIIGLQAPPLQPPRTRRRFLRRNATYSQLL